MCLCIWFGVGFTHPKKDSTLILFVENSWKNKRWYYSFHSTIRSWRWRCIHSHETDSDFCLWKIQDKTNDAYKLQRMYTPTLWQNGWPEVLMMRILVELNQGKWGEGVIMSQAATGVRFEQRFAYPYDVKMLFKDHNCLPHRNRFAWVSCTTQSELGWRSYGRFTKVAQSSKGCSRKFTRADGFVAWKHPTGRFVSEKNSKGGILNYFECLFIFQP